MTSSAPPLHCDVPRVILSWALYDWANSAFATIVATFIYSTYFTQAMAPAGLGGLREPRLRGFQIAFAWVDDQGLRREFSGRVSGARMEGGFRADNGSEGRWTATRK